MQLFCRWIFFIVNDCMWSLDTKNSLLPKVLTTEMSRIQDGCQLPPSYSLLKIQKFIKSDWFIVEHSCFVWCCYGYCLSFKIEVYLASYHSRSQGSCRTVKNHPKPFRNQGNVLEHSSLVQNYLKTLPLIKSHSWPSRSNIKVIRVTYNHEKTKIL